MPNPNLFTQKPHPTTRVTHTIWGKGTVKEYLSKELTPAMYRRNFCRVAFDQGGAVRWVDYRSLYLVS